MTITDLLLPEFDQEMASTRRLLERIPNDRLGRYRCVRNFVLHHLIHHRAQLTVYLREHDVLVPGMYGPTADEG